MCRERSQAKIMATLKTHILSVQFKLLRSKEGHLIFWAQKVLTTFDFQNIRTINQPAVCLLKPWLPSEREAGHWHAALCLHNFKSEEVVWCKPLDGSLHRLRRRVWSLPSEMSPVCPVRFCTTHMPCFYREALRMARASQGQPICTLRTREGQGAAEPRSHSSGSLALHYDVLPEGWKVSADPVSGDPIGSWVGG